MKQTIKTDDSAFKGVLIILMIMTMVFSCYMIIMLNALTL